MARFRGASGNDILIGGGTNDVLTGLGGNDVIRGRGGNDVLRGGPGNDELYGDAGDDLIVPGANNDIDTLWAGIGNDRYNFAGSVPTDFSFAFFFADYRKLSDPIIANIGVARGTVDKTQQGGQDTFLNIQNSSDNWGFGIADTPGNDSIRMQLGRDVFVSFQDGGGSDVYIGGLSFDRLTYANNGLIGGVDIVIQGYSNGGMRGFAAIENGDRDTFRNINEVQGSRLDDRFIGGAQRDRFIPDSGDDFFNGRGGDDLVIYDRSNATSVDLHLGRGVAAITYEDDFARNGTWFDRLLNIEDVRGTDGGDRIVGSRAANTLEGRDGNDRIIGLAGNDELFGQSGADVVAGAAGADTISGGDGRDVLTGGGGADEFQFFAGEFGVDRVRDFQDGRDRFFVAEASRFADLTLSEIGNASQHVRVEVGSTAFVVLNTGLVELSGADFLFG